MVMGIILEKIYLFSSYAAWFCIPHLLEIRFRISEAKSFSGEVVEHVSPPLGDN